MKLNKPVNQAKINMKQYHSIFFRMLKIFFVTGVILLIIMIILHVVHGRKEFRENFAGIISSYCRGILYDLGNPPDSLKASVYKNRLNIDIYYKGTHGCWTTSERIFPNAAKADSLVKKCDIYGKSNCDYYLKLTNNNDSFWFRCHMFPFRPGLKTALLSLGISLFIVLTVAYVALRQILKPVKYLIKGTQDVASGNLDVVIPCLSHDEFCTLTESFNTMLSAIRNMITQKKQLLYDVSHELRSPITRIKIALEMMPQSQNKSDIANDIKEMEIMIDEILEAARLEQTEIKLQAEQIDVGEFLSQVSNCYQDVLPGVAADNLQKDIIISANRNQLWKAFRNIIENALKFSSEQSKPVTVSIVKNDSMVMITVKDFGTGIDKEHIAYIFEPFYRADKSRSRDSGGYGLGLFLCKRIVESHGGKISAESTVGNGTAITVSLPVTLKVN